MRNKKLGKKGKESAENGSSLLKFFSKERWEKRRMILDSIPSPFSLSFNRLKKRTTISPSLPRRIGKGEIRGEKGKKREPFIQEKEKKKQLINPPNNQRMEKGKNE